VKVYEAIVKGENIPEPGIPESSSAHQGDAVVVPGRRGALETGEEIEMRELDEDVYRTAEELGIDISRPSAGSTRRTREGCGEEFLRCSTSMTSTS